MTTNAVTPGSLQTISSLYDVSEQAHDQSHVQFVFSCKDNVFRPPRALDACCASACRANVVSACAERLGGAYRDRTDDPLLAKQVLSQLS